jgi:hypothetical protein
MKVNLVFCLMLQRVGCNSNNVVVICTDGQRHRKLLYFKDRLVLPCVLDYDNMLLVVNNSTTAFLFDDTG